MAESKESYTTESDQQTNALNPANLGKDDLARLIKQIEKEMKDAAKALEFEKAAALRDQLVELRGLELQEKVQSA